MNDQLTGDAGEVVKELVERRDRRGRRDRRDRRKEKGEEQVTFFHWGHKLRPEGLLIKQIHHTHRHYNSQGEEVMSTPAGGTSQFQLQPIPAGSQFPAGTTFQWTVDDTADISLTPSSDGTQVTATCVAAPTGTSYNLTVTSSFTPPGGSAPLAATLNVPIIPAAPPTPTGIEITQIS